MRKDRQGFLNFRIYLNSAEPAFINFGNVREKGKLICPDGKREEDLQWTGCAQ
jgi:hypothetical protein